MKRKKKFDKKLMSITVPVATVVLQQFRPVMMEKCQQVALASANNLSAEPVEEVEFVREEPSNMNADSTNLVYVAWGKPKEAADGDA